MDFSHNFINKLKLNNSTDIIIQSVWTQDYLKLKLINTAKTCQNEWFGELSIEEIESSAEELEVPVGIFKKEFQEALNTIGGHNSFNYSIENDQLIVKKMLKFPIIYGSIKLYQTQGLKEQLLIDIIEPLHSLKDELQLLTEKYKTQENDLNTLKISYNDYVTANKNLEKDLISKFAVLLNAKKEKIADMQAIINNNKKQNITQNIQSGDTSSCIETDKDNESVFSQLTQILPKRKKLDQYAKKNNPGTSFQNISQEDKNESSENDSEILESQLLFDRM